MGTYQSCVGELRVHQTIYVGASPPEVPPQRALRHRGRLGHVKRRFFYLHSSHKRSLVLEEPRKPGISSLFPPLPVSPQTVGQQRLHVHS